MSEHQYPAVVIGVTAKGTDYPGAVERAMAAATAAAGDRVGFFIFSFSDEVVETLATFGDPTQFEPYGDAYMTCPAVLPPEERPVEFDVLVCVPADEIEERCKVAASEEWTGRPPTPVEFVTVDERQRIM